MSLKLKLMLLLTGITVTRGLAQDVLYRTNGESEQVKVTEINPSTITFKRWTNQDGPDIVIPKTEVSRIRFQNGTEEIFSRPRTQKIKSSNNDSQEDQEENYGRNVISIAPIQFTNTGVTGVGLSFEHQLDRKGNFSLYLPVAYSFRNRRWEEYSGQYYDIEQKSNVFWAYPGVRFYPTGSHKRTSYSVGPSLVIAAGRQSSSSLKYDPQTGNNIIKTEAGSIFQFGMMVNNAINIHPTPKLHLGFEFGFGIPYLDRNDDNSLLNDYSDVPLTQLQFSFGYRF